MVLPVGKLLDQVSADREGTLQMLDFTRNNSMQHLINTVLIKLTNATHLHEKMI